MRGRSLEHAHESDPSGDAELPRRASEEHGDRAGGEPEVVGNELVRVAHRGAGDDLLFAPREGALRRSGNSILLREQKPLPVVVVPVDERPFSADHRAPERAAASGSRRRSFPRARSIALAAPASEVPAATARRSRARAVRSVRGRGRGVRRRFSLGAAETQRRPEVSGEARPELAFRSRWPTSTVFMTRTRSSAWRSHEVLRRRSRPCRPVDRLLRKRCPHDAGRSVYGSHS